MTISLLTSAEAPFARAGAHAEGDRALEAVAVVVPCYNEQESLPQLFEQLDLLRMAWGERYVAEIVLVDDCSTDETWRELEYFAQRTPNTKAVRHVRNQGIAAAIMTGIQHATADIVCSIDADCSYDPAQLEQMIPLLAADVDMVTASPYHPHGAVHNVPGWRLWLSKSASRMYRVALRNKLHTYTSCFRVHRRSAMADLRLRNSGFVGVVEMLCVLDSRQSRIVEAPATLRIRQFGQSKMRVATVTWDHAKFMSSVLLHRLLRKPL